MTSFSRDFIAGEYIKYRINTRLATVIIDFPPANAMPVRGRVELLDILDKLLETEEVWAIILTGAGDKFFMSGANIAELLPLTAEEARDRVRQSRQFTSYIERYPRPIICAINGLATGGGLEVALCCDFRLLAEHAKVGLPEVSLGIMPGGGGTQRLPRLIGTSKTKELIYTGRLISATEAHSLGIVDKVVPFDGLMAEANKIAEAIISKAPLAIRAAKQAINASCHLPIEEGIKLENELWADLFATEDKNEGVTAFLEKRKPVFKGKIGRAHV
jgi:enoyl-CoA hydratase